MVIRTRLRAILFPLALYAVSGGVGGYFVWHAINGERGLKTRVAFKARIATALRERVWPLYAAGTMRPVVYRRFAMAEAAQAHRLMESSEHIGKIVITMP